MKVGIGWQIGLPSGWGTYGVNLAVQLARLGHRPVPLSVHPGPPRRWLDPLTCALLTPALREHALVEKLLGLHGEVDLPHVVLHGLADGLEGSDFSRRIRGAPDVGVVFFESSVVPKANLEAARRFEVIITGSRWNQMVLEAHGVTTARYAPQGIDPSLFHPAPRAGLLPSDRFVIFSGGKLEYRKGQDIVAAAFKIFQERHPDALLVTAWHNLWPESLQTLARSPHGVGVPALDDTGALQVSAWLGALGIPPRAVLDLGPVANSAMPRFLRDCDLAVFPNRCEGGTNLVAMEAMACGVPVVLSANTGHLDLIAGEEEGGEPVCWALQDQADLGRDAQGGVVAPWCLGWGESQVEEVLAVMEEAYASRSVREARGQAGAAFMRQWAWERQVQRVVDLLPG